MFKRSLVLAIVATPFFVTGAHAQKWDAPLFFSPRPMDDVGVYVTSTRESNLNNQNPTGLRLIWRQSGNLNLGVHAGVGDIEDVGQTILLGGEFYQPLAALSSNTGLIASWSLGAGAVFGDKYIDLSVPLGVSLGLNLGSGSSGVLPYVHPRISLDVTAVEDALGNEETITEVGWAVDIGADLSLGQTLVVRAAYTIGGNNDLGKRNAFGAGIALRIPRKVGVR